MGPIDVQIVIPRDLAPDDLDWENSRLLKPLPCGFGLFAKITRLELLIKDVIEEWRPTTPAAAPTPAKNNVVARAITFFITLLTANPDLRPKDVKPLLLEKKLLLGSKQFSFAWKTAREALGLKPTRPGRDRKSSPR